MKQILTPITIEDFRKWDWKKYGYSIESAFSKFKEIHDFKDISDFDPVLLEENSIVILIDEPKPQGPK